MPFLGVRALESYTNIHYNNSPGMEKSGVKNSKYINKENIGKSGRRGYITLPQ